MCTSQDEEQLKIDFLVESSFALKYLIERGRFEDAQRILNLMSSCGNLCSEENLNNHSTDCGCGKSL